MPEPERLLETLRRATTLFRSTPGKRGYLVRLSGARDVVVAGDLHGNVSNLSWLLQAVQLERHPGRHLVLQEVIHGDFTYADGSDQSHRLLDLLAALQCQYPHRVHLVMGNHEIAQWWDRAIGKDDETYNERFRRGVQFAYGGYADRIYDAYLELLSATALAVVIQDAIWISHSIPAGKRLDAFDPAALENQQWTAADVALGGFVHSLVWGRSTKSEETHEFLAKVGCRFAITGHLHCPAGFLMVGDTRLVLNTDGSAACYALVPAGADLGDARLEQFARRLR